MEKSYLTGSIDSSIIGDYVNIDYPARRQFPDDPTVEKWKSLGHLYVNYTGLLREEYRGLPEWCYDVLNELKKKINVKSSSMSMYCMPPGTIMPEHRDTYNRYRDVNNVQNSNDVCRILIFLSDWKSGHYFEVDDNPIINWKSGDYCVWFGETPHIAANIGRENRYTLQITSIIER